MGSLVRMIDAVSGHKLTADTEHGHQLSKAAEATPEDQEYISLRAARGLRGNVFPPPGDSRVPCPVAWIRELMKHSIS